MVSQDDFLPEDDPWSTLLDLFATSTAAWATLREIKSLRDNAMEAAEKLDEYDDHQGAAITTMQPELIRDLVLYFSFVSQVNEFLLSEAVYEHVVKEESKTDNMREIAHDMGPEYCLNILFAADLIDSGLKGEIGQVKEVRNKLLHEMTTRLAPQFEQDLTTQVDRGFRSVERLVDLALDLDDDLED